MFWQDWHETPVQAAVRRHPSIPAAAEDAWLRLAGFAPAERRRLIFLRWLYHQGRLTEFPRER